MSRAAKKRGLVWGAGLGLLAYVGLPYALAQFAGLGLIREGRKARRELALTFDDGPDPQTTPAVLDALAAAGARATFFVLAPRARAYPDLIARMLAEGHQVEPHAQRHVHAWLRTPWGAARDPVRAARDLAAITGQPATLHRPPHGAYTLGTLWGQRRVGVRGVHWSVEGRDWHAASTPQGVRERLGRLVYPGAVVVLHDAGPGARVTVPLLPDLLADLRSRGYGLVTLAELDGARPGDLAALRRRAFLLLDRLFDRAGHIRPVGGRADTLFRLGPVAFPLAGVRLADGTPVPKGTPAAEFHVNNPLIVDIGPRNAVRQGRARDLPFMARDLASRPDLRDAEVIFCLSALSPLLGIVHFETQAIPAADERRLRRWANVLRRVYGSQGEAQPPRLSILSRAEYLRLYGGSGPGTSRTLP